MSDYSTTQTPLTTSNIVVYGIISSQFLLGDAMASDSEYYQKKLHSLPYETSENFSSFDQMGNTYSSYAFDNVDRELMEVVSQLYGQLTQQQESLGTEFSKVLHDNLWDLYEE